MTRMLASVRTWGEMIKFSHSIFALPFALLAVFLAARPELPSPVSFALIVICMVAARSAAMTFNRIADARIDAGNPRTAGRPLPAGTIRPTQAWLFFWLACALFIAACGGFWFASANVWPLRLSVPTLLGLCLYSHAKRFTLFAHLWLGAGIAFAPVAAWIAIRPDTLGVTAWALMAGVLFWISGFDMIYACQDVDYDRRDGLHSIPARFGVPAALTLARFFHVFTVAALIGVGVLSGLGIIYYIGVACVALLLIVENAIVSPNDLSRVNLAFFTVNGVVGLVLGTLGIIDVCMHLPTAP